MSEVEAMLNTARANAALVVDRHVNPNQKKASLALYDVLAECKRLCERCDHNAEDFEEVKRLFAEQPKSGNRRYVEKGSDIYVFVCRFVFTETDRTNAMRYASALREAEKLQISGANLASYLKNKGGVNGLYFRRPLDERSQKTKCLRLSSQITYSRDEEFTLRLRWLNDNTFEVLP